MFFPTVLAPLMLPNKNLRLQRNMEQDVNQVPQSNDPTSINFPGRLGFFVPIIKFFHHFCLILSFLLRLMYYTMFANKVRFCSVIRLAVKCGFWSWILLKSQSLVDNKRSQHQITSVRMRICQILLALARSQVRPVRLIWSGA